MLVVMQPADHILGLCSVGGAGAQSSVDAVKLHVCREWITRVLAEDCDCSFREVLRSSCFGQSVEPQMILAAPVLNILQVSLLRHCRGDMGVLLGSYGQY